MPIKDKTENHTETQVTEEVLEKVMSRDTDELEKIALIKDGEERRNGRYPIY